MYRALSREFSYVKAIHMKAKDALQELKRDKERKYSGFTLIQPEDFPLCMPAGHHSSCWIWIQHEQPHG